MLCEGRYGACAATRSASQFAILREEWAQSRIRKSFSKITYTRSTECSASAPYLIRLLRKVGTARRAVRKREKSVSNKRYIIVAFAAPLPASMPQAA